VDGQPPFERLDTIGDPPDPAAVPVRATDAVVGNGHLQTAVSERQRDRDTVGPGVFDRVAERLADDEVGDALDGLGQARWTGLVPIVDSRERQPDRDRQRPNQLPDRGHQPPLA
jgi:hypothetical protein